MAFLHLMFKFFVRFVNAANRDFNNSLKLTVFTTMQLMVLATMQSMVLAKMQLMVFFFTKMPANKKTALEQSHVIFFENYTNVSKRFLKIASTFQKIISGR